MQVQGSVTTTATTEVAIENSAYTEQTSGAQRSLKSSSAADAAAGTGARTVMLRYYTLASDGTIAGPFFETVTLTGTVAVATVATNIALVDSLRVVTAGSGGVAAGTVSLYDDAAGVGSAFASIPTGTLGTDYAHSYVPSGRRAQIQKLLTSSDGGIPKVALRSKAFGVTGAAEQVLHSNIVGNFDFTASPIIVAGPARIRAYVTPADTSSQISRANYEVIAV